MAQEWNRIEPQLKTRWSNDVSPTNARPEYPRPQMKRPDWLNLNGVWDFGLGGEQKFDRKILVPYPPESALSGIQKHDEHVWYRRTFQIPKDWGDRTVLLHFGAVDWETTVWVNGKEIGKHRGAYDPFSFDITDAIKREAENEIIVAVVDPTDKGTQPIGKQRLKPEGIWYTSVTGIWQTVWLEPVSANHVRSLKIVPDLDSNSVVVTAEVPNARSADKIEIVVEGGDRPVRAGPVAADERKTDADNFVTARLAISRVKPWSPESPFLYGLSVTITRDGKPVDRVESYFGMRKIEVKRDGKFQRILLNDKPITMTGPLDQGFWPDGIYTAPTHEAMVYDLEMTKKLGFNMIRKHVKVEPATWYEWCDRNGMLVWQDMPSMFPPKEKQNDPETTKQFELELARLIETHRNSPSIIMWVVFNEGCGQYETERLTKWTKEADPTRLVNNASGWTDMKVGDVMDMHKYPGPAAPAAEQARAVVLGEFGGLGLPVEGHTWIQKKFSYKEMKTKEQLTEQYVKLFEQAWQLMRDQGLCACVYTQTTDVEGEINGFMTYDREILKLDLGKARAANTGAK